MIQIDEANEMIGRVLSALRLASEGLTLPGLTRSLSLDREDRPRLRRNLRELEEEGAVVKIGRRYFFPRGFRLARGRMVTVGRGFAFVRLEKDGGDVFVPGRAAGSARRGDRVELLLSPPGGRGKPEGRVVRVVERRHESLLGIVKERRGRLILQPYDSPDMQDIPLTLSPGRRIPMGAVVEIDRDSLTVGRVLGPPDGPGVDLEVIARRYDLSSEFSPEAEAEAGGVSDAVSRDELAGRMDFREWMTVTIDGPDARDFDDAVSIRRLPDRACQLGVHIADVAHYVPEGSFLDRDALRKGTSVYFPERAFHMLPESLSQGLCSLLPGEDRRAMSVLLTFNREGRAVETSLTPSLIRSDARLTYDEARDLFGEYSGRKAQPASPVSDLSTMRRLAGLLRADRFRRGGLDIERPEPRLRMSGAEVMGIESHQGHEAHHLIEEFMIAANRAVAEYLSARGAALLFRVHPKPSIRSLGELRSRLSDFGCSLPQPERIGVRDLQSALEWAKSRPEAGFLSLVLLRSLKLAYYSMENIGHFGLGLTAYTHFTSPIRRYPDLVVHRILKTLLSGRDAPRAQMVKIARHCSERERLAEAAERDLLEWRILRFLKTRLGDVVRGNVIDITRSGLVVDLPEYFVSGIVLHEDRPDVAPRGGRSSVPQVLPGDQILVTLAAVDPDTRRILLVPASDRGPQSR